MLKILTDSSSETPGLSVGTHSFQSVLTAFSHFLKVDSFVPRAAASFLWLSPFKTLCLALMKSSSVKVILLLTCICLIAGCLSGEKSRDSVTRSDVTA